MRWYFTFVPISILQYFSLGYDNTAQTCQECSLGYYRIQGLMNTSLLYPSDCIQKSPSDILYQKTMYVSNQSSCSSSCSGTQDAPFDSLISAMIYIHNVDLAEKYMQQNIEIKLLGNPHHIIPSDLILYDMRLFRRMNATVSLSPVFCEEDFLIGCFFLLRGDTADLHIHSDAFNF